MKAAGGGKTNGDRRVQGTAAYGTDAEGHHQHTEPESERDAGEADANLRECGGKHGASAPAKDQPERSNELCCQWACVSHEWLPESNRTQSVTTQEGCL